MHILDLFIRSITQGMPLNFIICLSYILIGYFLRKHLQFSWANIAELYPQSLIDMHIRIYLFYFRHVFWLNAIFTLETERS